MLLQKHLEFAEFKKISFQEYIVTLNFETYFWDALIPVTENWPFLPKQPILSLLPKPELSNQKTRSIQFIKKIKLTLVTRILSQLFLSAFAHPILMTTYQKWPLSHFHISYQNSEISWQKMPIFALLYWKCAHFLSADFGVLVRDMKMT